MELKTGRKVEDGLLDKVIDSAVIAYASFGFEDLGDALDITAQSLQEDSEWFPNSPETKPLTYEEAVEIMEIIEQPVRCFADELADTYCELREKYEGTKSWELYRKEVEKEKLSSSGQCHGY